MKLILPDLKYLEKEKPYLTTEQINHLLNNDFYFGAHSTSHPRYSLLSLEEQLEETVKSVKYVASKFNLKYKLFSFPFSDDGVSPVFFEKILKEKSADSTFGSAGLKNQNNEFHFQRIPMEYVRKYTAKQIVRGELMYYFIKIKLFSAQM